MEGGSASCGRTAGCRFGGLAGVVGVAVGSPTGSGGCAAAPSPINGGADPMVKPLGIPFEVVGGAFFAIVLVEVGRAGSCSRNAPCSCGGARG